MTIYLHCDLAYDMDHALQTWSTSPSTNMAFWLPMIHYLCEPTIHQSKYLPFGSSLFVHSLFAHSLFVWSHWFLTRSPHSTSWCQRWTIGGTDSGWTLQVQRWESRLHSARVFVSSVSSSVSPRIRPLLQHLEFPQHPRHLTWPVSAIRGRFHCKHSVRLLHLQRRLDCPGWSFTTLSPVTRSFMWQKTMMW